MEAIPYYSLNNVYNLGAYLFLSIEITDFEFICLIAVIRLRQHNS